jgi:oxalate decarboxylase/phosphoglucose isomerase-like protein (cupin superfamily)
MQKGALIDTFGAVHVAVTSGEGDLLAHEGIVTVGSMAKDRVLLAKYVQALKPHGSRTGKLGRYVFDDASFVSNAAKATGKDVLQQLKVPTPLQRHSEACLHKGMKAQDEPCQVFFSIGPSGTGLPFHFHSETWNVVAHGRKRWAVFGPSGQNISFNPEHTLLQWLTEVAPKSGARPLEVIQEEGDVLYIPEGYYHAVLNLGETVSVAHQLNVPINEWFSEYYNAMQEPDIDKKIRSLERAAAAAPGYCDVHSALGAALFEASRLPEAELAFFAAMTLNPLDAGTYVNMCHVLLASGDGKASVANIQAVLNRASLMLTGPQLGSRLDFVYKGALYLGIQASDVSGSWWILLQAEARGLLERSSPEAGALHQLQQDLQEITSEQHVTGAIFAAMSEHGQVKPGDEQQAFLKLGQGAQEMMTGGVSGKGWLQELYRAVGLGASLEVYPLVLSFMPAGDNRAKLTAAHIKNLNKAEKKNTEKKKKGSSQKEL